MIKYSWLNVKYSIELKQIWANPTLRKQKKLKKKTNFDKLHQMTANFARSNCTKRCMNFQLKN